MAEWSIASVLKTEDPQGSGGSNPSPSDVAHFLKNSTDWRNSQDALSVYKTLMVPVVLLENSPSIA